jgi:ATP-dependent DNA ligase
MRPAAFVEPCIPTLAKTPPAGPAWVHEIKHDGYRLMVWRDGERVRLFTRRGFDWTDRYPRIAHSARRLPVARFLIDGEAVVCGEDGVSDFERLHSREHDASVFLYAFDLRALGGTDIRHEQLDHRRAMLHNLLVSPDGIRFSEHLDGDGARIFAHACKLGLEGIVTKRAMQPICQAVARPG